jgi:hypothetical protein
MFLMAESGCGNVALAGEQERGCGPWRRQVSMPKSAASFYLGRTWNISPKIPVTTGLALTGLPDLVFQSSVLNEI